MDGCAPMHRYQGERVSQGKSVERDLNVQLLYPMRSLIERIRRDSKVLVVIFRGQDKNLTKDSKKLKKRGDH